MRLTLLVILSVFVATGLFAFEAGTINPGGGFSSSSYKADSDSDALTSFTLYPSIGLFVIDNLSADFLLTCLDQKQGSSEYSRMNIGIGGRFYVTKFYGGLGVLYNSWKSGSFESSRYFFQLSGGYMIPVTEQVHIDLGAKYLLGFGKYGKDYSHIDNEGKELQINAGIQVFIPTRK
ncbi:MAG: hypothetical protein U1C33_00675 [Candidatus Cloacimonadaceae bacterium]|nr:hypothetical protein [Candidatus Cloacimonadaceae bacterium]